MESAFGVEHGDQFSKAFEMPKMPTGLLKPVTSLGSKMGSGTANLGRKAGTWGGAQLKAGNLNRAGLGGSAGNRLRGAGNFMSAHPTGTGGAAIGAGGLGVGGTAYGVNRHRNNQQR